MDAYIQEEESYSLFYWVTVTMTMLVMLKIGGAHLVLSTFLARAW
jgi:hypothetical protein